MRIRRLNTNDRIIGQIQDNIANVLEPITNIPLNYGVRLTNVILTSGSNTVNHGLNRTLLGWFVTRQRSSATIYDTQDSNTNPTKTLILVASANVTVDLFVF